MNYKNVHDSSDAELIINKVNNAIKVSLCTAEDLSNTPHKFHNNVHNQVNLPA